MFVTSFDLTGEDKGRCLLANNALIDLGRIIDHFGVVVAQFAIGDDLCQEKNVTYHATNCYVFD